MAHHVFKVSPLTLELRNGNIHSRTLLAHGVSVIVYLLIPLEVFCVAFFCPWPKAALCGSAMPLIASQYVVAASLTRIYFIKPYYNYFIKKFYKLFPSAAKLNSVFTYNTTRF